MWILYGIKQCDTCRKALKWFSEQGIEHKFHDLRVDGLDASLLDQWLETVDVNDLVNRRSTTWRGLSDAEKSASSVEARHDLLLQQPTLIKRPVLVNQTVRAIGFKPDQWADLIEG